MSCCPSEAFGWILWPPGCRGCPRPEQNDVVLAAVLQHFARRAAWDAAADFFAEVAREHAPAVVHLCAALRRLGRGDDAVQARSPLCHSLRSRRIVCVVLFVLSRVIPLVHALAQAVLH
jgi:hypothetical protein